MDLRPYQVEAISAARAKLAGGARSVLLICPTGGGKTVVAASIIHSAVAKGSRVLFLAHRRELIQQTCDKLRRFDVRHGVIMAGVPTALQQPVQVASVQTLARRPGILQQVDLLFLDEAHHATSESYQAPLRWWPGAKVVGLTATPWRLDGRGLADVFASHVVARTPAELRDEGWLCPVGGWEYQALDTSRARVQRGDFAVGDLAIAAKSTAVMGDVVQEWLRYAGGKRTILFACNVEHSQHLVELFRAEGVPAEHVDGEMPAAERDAVLARLRSGQTLVVSNCNVLTEGFDCPELEVCVLARPTLSTSLYLQMVGRVLRPAEGKERARIHDHAGCLAAHGHPYADRDYSPEETARADRQEAEKRAPPEKRCRACQSVIARWPCDACGYSPTPAELRTQYLMEEARRREIGNDPAAAAEDPELESRRQRWRRDYLTDAGKRRALWDRLVGKHGTRKAKGVYRWFSGELEWPPRAWSAEAG